MDFIPVKTIHLTDSAQEHNILCGAPPPNFAEELHAINLQNNRNIPNYEEMFYGCYTEMSDTITRRQDIGSQLISSVTLEYDTIHRLTMEQLPYAMPTMQRYIMAQPELNLKYKKNLVDGYSETYFNMEPDVYGKDRIEYQEVMDGVLNTYENHSILTNYSGSNHTDLTTLNKLDILDTWNNISLSLIQGIDPTDVSLVDDEELED